MKRKIAVIVLAIVFVCVFLIGCGATDGNGTVDRSEVENSVGAEDKTESEEQTEADGVDIRIGALKGPTSMGLVRLMELSDEGETVNNYDFTMAVAADELLPKLVSGDLDIVLVPANVASILYNNTKGGVSVIDINTLGVLYMVSGDESVKSMEDLKGKTLYLTGKGTTPDYVLQYLLNENGMSTQDLTLEYKSEATEVAALLAENPDAVGLLPQPFVTAACMQNEALSIVIDMTKEWDEVQGEDGSSLVTGVTVVNNNFLQQNPEAVAKFIEEHKESAAYANENVEAAAELVAARGIVEKPQVAAKAIPYCNIVCIDAEEMKQALSGYLEVLYNADASSIGGSLPGDDFYYLP
ncbi:MAG: ABC transporter substrate-binding protein [Lachnospiraceae bacterium]|nr:ABC transporter substrate-binding protein [Lachnospiraceae bacterium]